MACGKARAAFARSTPDMLKYQPKRFWGFVKRQVQEESAIDMAEFARFNQALFLDPAAPVDTHHPLAHPEEHHITPEELEHTLAFHFKANKSSGFSPMPLQVLKHMGGEGVRVLADFLSKSAIDQLAPAEWRATKVVPLYKGKGLVTDMNSYRSIAITPPFTKLFMSVINRRLTSVAEEQELHAPTQAGFRAHHTTTEQALIV